MFGNGKQIASVAGGIARALGTYLRYCAQCRLRTEHHVYSRSDDPQDDKDRVHVCKQCKSQS